MVRFIKYWGGILITLVFTRIIIFFVKLFLNASSNEKTFEFLTPNYSSLVSFLKHGVITIDMLVMLLVMIVSMWFILDFRSGQLLRDWQARNLGRYLMKFVANDSNNQMSVNEESQSNHYVNRCRILKKDGLLFVQIPCGKYAAVCETIMDRCVNAHVANWLHECYPSVNWKQPEKEMSLFGNKIVIRQK